LGWPVYIEDAEIVKDDEFKYVKSHP